MKDNKIFVTQRGYGEFKDYWEFPGGKIEVNEDHKQALIREISEELEAKIAVDKYLCSIQHDYADFHLIMHCYICSLISDKINLLEHEAAKWLSIDELDDLNWLEADIKVVEELKSFLYKT